MRCHFSKDLFSLSILFFNIGISSYAIKYPHQPPPRPTPVPSPVPPPPSAALGSPITSLSRSSISTMPRSGSKVELPPNVCPLFYCPSRVTFKTDGHLQTTPRRQLPFSSSVSSSISASDPRNLARSYSLGFSDPNLSFGASTPSPSPSPLAAYKGRRGAAVGRECHYTSI